MYYRKYEGENIYLSPMSVDDYKTYTKWLNDETLASGLGGFSLNISEEYEKEFLEKNNKEGNPQFAIIRKSDNVLLGNYGLEERDKIARRYHVGGFIGEKEERGKGYGTEALKLITRFGFEALNAQMLYSGIFAFNQGSLKSAEKAGYQIVGKFRDFYFYNGKFHDQISVQITKDDYLELKKKGVY